MPGPLQPVTQAAASSSAGATPWGTAAVSSATTVRAAMPAATASAAAVRARGAVLWESSRASWVTPPAAKAAPSSGARPNSETSTEGDADIQTSRDTAGTGKIGSQFMLSA